MRVCVRACLSVCVHVRARARVRVRALICPSTCLATTPIFWLAAARLYLQTSHTGKTTAVLVLEV